MFCECGAHAFPRLLWSAFFCLVPLLIENMFTCVELNVLSFEYGEYVCFVCYRHNLELKGKSLASPLALGKVKALLCLTH